MSTILNNKELKDAIQRVSRDPHQENIPETTVKMIAEGKLLGPPTTRAKLE